MRVRPLSVADVELVAFRLAKEHLAWDEPIPDFGTRVPHTLERCLVTPFQSFGGRQLYHGLIGKAAMLFYLLIKNHPFLNGNKRIAVMALLVFLATHGKWLRVDPQELYRFAVWIAASNPRVKDATVAAIEQFVRVYLKDHAHA
ncbi:MAG: type II toxin-antitoxin system death-on-curing family toxin [bacterium]|nr:type II toxin-antitoxin system death-on-curing family toxin [bacterium]